MLTIYEFMNKKKGSFSKHKSKQQFHLISLLILSTLLMLLKEANGMTLTIKEMEQLKSIEWKGWKTLET